MSARPLDLTKRQVIDLVEVLVWLRLHAGPPAFFQDKDIVAKRLEAIWKTVQYLGPEASPLYDALVGFRAGAPEKAVANNVARTLGAAGGLRRVVEALAAVDTAAHEALQKSAALRYTLAMSVSDNPPRDDKPAVALGLFIRSGVEHPLFRVEEP